MTFASRDAREFQNKDRMLIHGSVDHAKDHIEARLQEQLKEANLTLFLKKNIFHIVQENLNNALKHSNASQFWVTLNEKNRMLRLTFCDSGHGIRDEEMKNPESFHSIRARVAALGQSIEVEPVKDIGLSIEIGVPLD